MFILMQIFNICMISLVQLLKKSYCWLVNIKLFLADFNDIVVQMAAVPQAAFLTIKSQQNKDRNLEKQCPLQYNSKLMNSIWGLYNRYSVHNLKKNMDKTISINTAGKQIPSVTSNIGGTSEVLAESWKDLYSGFKYPY